MHASAPPLSIVCGSYDAFSPLREGIVEPAGCRLDWTLEEDPPTLFSRVVEHGEFDIAEMSLSQYVRLRSVEALPYRAIPVFPLRMFRHAYVTVGSALEVRSPADITGLRVGVPDYWQTAAVWTRGMLAETWDIDWAGCRWVQAGMDSPRSRDLVSGVASRALDRLSAGVEIEPVADRSLDELLSAGELDVTIGARLPVRSLAAGRARRLFADPRAEEEAFFRRTGVFPIMHTLVVREDRLAANPSLAADLTEAFTTAVDLRWRRVLFSGSNPTLLPWGHEEALAAQELFGGTPWRQGVEANRVALERFLGYLEADGLAVHPPLGELFAPAER